MTDIRTHASTPIALIVLAAGLVATGLSALSASQVLRKKSIKMF